MSKEPVRESCCRIAKESAATQKCKMLGRQINSILCTVLVVLFETIALKILKTTLIKAPFEVNVKTIFQTIWAPHQKFNFSGKHHNEQLYYPSFCKADKKIHIPLVSHLLSDKTALDVALGTLGPTRHGVNESTSLTADNVSGINSLAVFCRRPTGNLTIMCAHKFPFYWIQLASQRWEMF